MWLTFAFNISCFHVTPRPFEGFKPEMGHIFSSSYANAFLTFLSKSEMMMSYCGDLTDFASLRRENGV